MFKHRHPQEEPLPEFKNEWEKRYYTLAAKIEKLDGIANTLAYSLKAKQKKWA